jgi:hypothetical protein
LRLRSREFSSVTVAVHHAAFALERHGLVALVHVFFDCMYVVHHREYQRSLVSVHLNVVDLREGERKKSKRYWIRYFKTKNDKRNETKRTGRIDEDKIQRQSRLPHSHRRRG